MPPQTHCECPVDNDFSAANWMEKRELPLFITRGILDPRTLSPSLSLSNRKQIIMWEMNFFLHFTRA